MSLVRTLLLLLVALGSLLGKPELGLSQSRTSETGLNEIFADSELENYLRYLQTTGEVALYPWSLRGFSPVEIDRLLPSGAVHPWSSRFPLRRDSTSGPTWSVVAPRAALTYNSRFPFGSNDGAVWAGRGLTTAVQAGVSGRWGPISAVVAPIFFRAENTDPGPDDLDRRYIDLPARFGSGAYRRIDPGQSTLRVDLPIVTFGVSTANQHWGPVGDLPLIMGSNAPGFPHAFLGTSEPVNLWAAHLHARLVWGRLTTSPFATTPADSTHRLASALVVSLTPRGVPGLEVGLTRFFNVPWPEDGLGRSDLTRPLDHFLKRSADYYEGNRVDIRDDQLVSVFARWVAPRSGFEVYGEYGREDYNFDRRDFIVEPDHTGAYSVGVRKAWERDDGFLALRMEVLNSRRSHLARVRSQGTFYTHVGGVGHTNMGQILGSDAGFGGAGSVVALDRYSSNGRFSVTWERVLRQARETFRDPALEYDPDAMDVQHAIRVERLIFRRGFDLVPAITGVYEMNRNFGGDAFNLGAEFQVRARF
jgi:hypothetical protein